jgi:hypothetical protein
MISIKCVKLFFWLRSANLSKEALRTSSPTPKISCSGGGRLTPNPIPTINVAFAYNTPSNGYVTLTWAAMAGAQCYTLDNTQSPAPTIILNNVNVLTNSFVIQAIAGQLETVTVTASNPCGSAYVGEGCFLAGSRVLLSDNITKPIEDIKVGDLVIGAFGQINKVEGLSRPLLGSYDMICINDEHKSSYNHPHVTLDKKFCCMDISKYNKNSDNVLKSVLNKNGNHIIMKMERVKVDELSQLEIGTELKTSCGSKIVKTLDTFPMPSDTQLYNLVIDGNHTFHVNGYAVRGWKRHTA